MSFSKTLYPILRTGSTQVDLSLLDSKNVDWHIKDQTNKTKTKAVLFTQKNFDHMPLLKFENTHMKFVESHKHLGLTLS